MGMGLGSCRALLFSDEHLKDFDVRHLIGDDLPFYANLGIAQLEELIENNEVFLINNLIEKLRADGLIIHVNPLQEWLQPEGDRFKVAPIDTIETILEKINYPIKLLGISMGGMMVCDWIMSYPNEVDGAVIINSSRKGYSPTNKRLKFEIIKTANIALSVQLSIYLILT